MFCKRNEFLIEEAPIKNTIRLKTHLVEARG